MVKRTILKPLIAWESGATVAIQAISIREWGNEHLDADDYEAIFGKFFEDESLVSNIIKHIIRRSEASQTRWVVGIHREPDQLRSALVATLLRCRKPLLKGMID